MSGEVSRRRFIGGAAAATLAGAPAVVGLGAGPSVADAAESPAGARSGRKRARARAAAEPFEPRIEALLAQMTLADKIAQLNIPQVLPQIFLEPTSPTGSDANRERWVRGTWLRWLGPGGGLFGLLNETIFGALPVRRPRTPREQAELTNSLQRTAAGTRLGIPLLQIGEGTNGLAAPGATIFPEGPGLAATWNPALVESVYATVAREGRAVGVHALNTLLAEINRDPRFGRGCEGYGEDPYLVGEIVRALVRGIQGDDVSAADRCVASLCHYPFQTPNVGGLEGSSVELGERAMRSEQLRPWEVGFSDEGALMSLACQATIDGVPVHGSEELLTEIMRDELGFQGIVLSEGGGFDSLVRAQVAADQKEAGALAIRAGVDVGITWEAAYLDQLIASVQDGSVPMALIDRAVRRVLYVKLKLGLFENPYVDPARAERVVHSAAHQATALQAARESIVLLKNAGGLLPLRDAGQRIAVIGPNADEAENLLGDYHPWPPLEPIPSILTAIRAHAPGGSTVTYARGCEITGEDRSGFDAAVAAAQGADVALVVVGEKAAGFFHPGATNGEACDVASLDLTGVQDELIEAVRATGTPTVVVLVHGRPLSIRAVAEHVPAILSAWLPGERGGEALTDVLFGRCDPGGRLPITVPRSVGQLPLYNSLRPMRATAGDYVDLPSSPLFPFGFGLSYTTFSYANLALSRTRIGAGETTEVRVDVTNTGSRSGQEVVQLYVADVHASVSVPEQQLRGFRKVALDPGQTTTVRMTLGPRELALVDQALETVVEPGTFELRVGSSCADIHARATLEVT
ncbi:MAG: glycoside hydrolase family 3 C-terminal domain-containing protein [Conexibacter sp.]